MRIMAVNIDCFMLMKLLYCIYNRNRDVCILYMVASWACEVIVILTQ